MKTGARPDNMIAPGAYIKHAGIVSIENAIESLKAMLTGNKKLL